MNNMKKEKLKIGVSAVFWGIIIAILMEMAILFMPSSSKQVYNIDFLGIFAILIMCFACLAGIWWTDEQNNIEN